MTALQAYQDILADCRFCPMCKPAAEVANRRKIEGYSTRSRAMMLWRIAMGLRGWTPRSTELLYQSTLDGISEAFCVSDRPVSGYTLAARQDVWDAGLAPEPVRAAVARVAGRPPDAPLGERVLVAAECAEAGWDGQAAAVARACGLDLLLMPVGATPWALGAREAARSQAEAAREYLRAADLVVADGPQTQWLLTMIWPQLDLELTAEVRSLPAHALAGVATHADDTLGDCYIVDSRAAAYLSDALARPVAIQPGYVGEPDDAGRGAIYDDLRALLGRLGAREQRHRWERSLSRSTGADDGLWASYPELADDLAAALLELAASSGASRLVTDSALAAARLARVPGGVPVSWIGELVASD